MHKFKFNCLMHKYNCKIIQNKIFIYYYIKDFKRKIRKPEVYCYPIFKKILLKKLNRFNSRYQTAID